MKVRRHRVHLMSEFDRTRSRCGAHVSMLHLTDIWDQVTCAVCARPHDPDARRRISEILAKAMGAPV